MHIYIGYNTQRVNPTLVQEFRNLNCIHTLSNSRLSVLTLVESIHLQQMLTKATLIDSQHKNLITLYIPSISSDLQSIKNCLVIVLMTNV